MSALDAIALDPCNEVHLVGRVTGEPVVTVLPSGDELVTARVAVPRPRPPAGRGRRGSVDTVACTAWAPAVRRTVRGWCKDDVVEVRGSLRRRFWRNEDGPRSRYEVEMSEVMVIAAAPAGRDRDERGTAAVRSDGPDADVVDEPDAGGDGGSVDDEAAGATPDGTTLAGRRISAAPGHGTAVGSVSASSA